MNLRKQMQQPLRYPDETDQRFMTKRARWLLVLGFLFPGSAQILAGKRGLGRLAYLSVWLLLALGAVAAICFTNFRSATINFFANPVTLLALQVLVGIYLLLWLVLGFNTLALSKLQQTQRLWRMPLAVVALLCIFAPLVLGGWVFNTLNASRETVVSLFTERASFPPDANGRYNVLLMGSDAGPGREGLRPDSLTLASVDAKTGSTVLIGLPRNLEYAEFAKDSPMYKEYPTGFGRKDGCNVGVCMLNGIYTEAQEYFPELYPNAAAAGSSPGIEATKDAVSGSTGLPIHFYVLINMAGFEKLIDALGGVEINVTDRIPIGGDDRGNNIEGYLEPGKQLLNGKSALWFARSRSHADRGDYDRMERQRELQAAILKQMDPKNVLFRFDAIIKSGQHFAQTDMPRSMVGTLSDLALRAKKHTPVRLELAPPTVNTGNPDYDEIRELVANAIKQADAQAATH